MRLPAVRPSFVRPILVANLVGEIVIVITGGIVRLTGSGLGCPTWPECVPGSFTPVPHQEEGIHKLIEFGNRTLTGVVGLLALACVWVVFTRMRRRRPLLLVAVGLVAGVFIQAVVGGIAVRMTLSPVVVAFHFLLSMVMIALSTMLLRGVGGRVVAGRHRRPRAAGAARSAPGVDAGVGDRGGYAPPSSCWGRSSRGPGPHSGDAEQPARTGFDPRSVAWLHADVVMLFVGLVVAVLVAVCLTSSSDRAKATWRGVLLVTLLQGAIGYVQYFTGLPEVLVGLHMLGASLLVVTMVLGVMNLRSNPL